MEITVPATTLLVTSEFKKPLPYASKYNTMRNSIPLDGHRSDRALSFVHRPMYLSVCIYSGVRKRRAPERVELPRESAMKQVTLHCYLYLSVSIKPLFGKQHQLLDENICALNAHSKAI